MKIFEPTSIKYMMPEDKRRYHEDIIILEQKSTRKKLKGRMVLNGKPTREWLSREGNSIPAESLENFFTETIDAYERRDITFMDVPNAFIQTKMSPKKDVE